MNQLIKMIQNIEIFLQVSRQYDGDIWYDRMEKQLNTLNMEEIIQRSTVAVGV